MNLIARFCKKKNPQRAACATLVEREEKGFKVAYKRWKRNKGATTVLMLGGPSVVGASRVKAPRGVRCEEGVSPSKLGKESGVGVVPPSQKFF